MKGIVFGAGFLGTRIANELGYKIVSRNEADALNVNAVSAFLDAVKPDVVINAVGKTGRPHIDWCEEHKEETLASNVTAATNLCMECTKRKIYFVHLGSGCVYQGYNNGKGYSEEDEPNFYGSFYSRTKILAEKNLKEFPVLQLRLRLPIDDRPNERNLIDKVRKYQKVIDTQNSVTSIPHMLEALKILIGKRRAGVYNLVNPGTISPAEVMQLYKEIVDPNHSFETFSSDELDLITKAKRSNCSLNTGKLKAEGINLPEIHGAVRECLLNYRTCLPLKMKGIILAGGKGTRLWPLTAVTNKHLVPVGDLPMLEYPLFALRKLGIKSICVVTGGEHFQHIAGYLAETHKEIDFSYHYQKEAGGIAQALGLTENFVGGEKIAVILGDNVYDEEFYEAAKKFEGSDLGAMLFLKEVPDPQRFGVAQIEGDKIISVEEKPKQPKSNLAVTGIYFYDSTVFDKIKKLKPSARGELEITDVNNMYIQEGRLGFHILKGFWSDAGTFKSREKCEEFLRKGFGKKMLASLPEDAKRQLPEEIRSILFA